MIILYINVIVNIYFMLSYFQFNNWGNASFESDERKEKFLRLMGGFKKSSNLESSTSSSRPKTLFGAMSKSQETSLNNDLEDQYQRAFDFSRKSRGRGLGYDPDLDPENKTFFIDKESKSTKL